jgi:amino acid transporter
MNAGRASATDKLCSRSLKSRHIQFIALGGTIGTGLFLGIGSAFTQAGPLSVLLGYSFTGVAIFAMMQCLGEMATWLPLPGSIPQFCARYVDDALGFAVGWNVSFRHFLAIHFFELLVRAVGRQQKMGA